MQKQLVWTLAIVFVGTSGRPYFVGKLMRNCEQESTDVISSRLLNFLLSSYLFNGLIIKAGFGRAIWRFIMPIAGEGANDLLRFIQIQTKTTVTVVIAAIRGFARGKKAAPNKFK
jgi:hypothetical protein